MKRLILIIALVLAYSSVHAQAGGNQCPGQGVCDLRVVGIAGWALPIPDELWTQNFNKVIIPYRVDLTDLNLDGSLLITEFSMGLPGMDLYPLDGQEVIRVWLSRTKFDPNVVEPYTVSMEYGIYDSNGDPAPNSGGNVVVGNARLKPGMNYLELVFNRNNSVLRTRVRENVNGGAVLYSLSATNQNLDGVFPETFVVGVLEDSGAWSGALELFVGFDDTMCGGC
ncbi:MAG: hypothetical protein DHS20C11_10130 [Lysobacteraceae bacterium]|nr:MAG: hypothetical protein DHS20C11_10130 [Xanthomonadaceae bacterium]